MSYAGTWGSMGGIGVTEPSRVNRCFSLENGLAIRLIQPFPSLLPTNPTNTLLLEFYSPWNCKKKKIGFLLSKPSSLWYIARQSEQTRAYTTPVLSSFSRGVSSETILDPHRGLLILVIYILLQPDCTVISLTMGQCHAF